jgi:hypothetical protein
MEPDSALIDRMMGDLADRPDRSFVRAWVSIRGNRRSGTERRIFRDAPARIWAFSVIGG